MTTKLKDVHLSNGMAWNGDQTSMFFIDSLKRKVYSFDYSADHGEISNQRTVRDYWEDPERLGLPDGMTIDTYESNACLVCNNTLCNSVSVLHNTITHTYTDMYIDMSSYIACISCWVAYKHTHMQIVHILHHMAFHSLISLLCVHVCVFVCVRVHACVFVEMTIYGLLASAERLESLAGHPLERG